MKPKDDIHKLIKKLQIKASVELDRRVNDDISRALAKSQETEPAVMGPTILRLVTKGGVMKLAIAAAIIIAFGLGFSVGQRSKPTQMVIYSLDVTGSAPAVSVYPTAPKAESSFWQQKAIAAMQPRPYAQTVATKISLLNAYKQYLKGETL
jgi:ABC-type anion transport system duplicated permease subunit